VARITSYEVPLSTILSNFLSLSCRHAPQHPVLEHLSLCPSLGGRFPAYD